MVNTHKSSPVTIVFGGDEYLNSRALRSYRDAARHANPQADVAELRAEQADVYELEEAVSPTLLSTSSIVVIPDLQNAGDDFIEALSAFAQREAKVKPGSVSSMVIASHDGSMKGRKNIDILKKKGAFVDTIVKLANDRTRANFVREEFRSHHRRIQEQAVNQLVAVLGGRTGELAAMCEQLCFDFDEDPLSLETMMNYLGDAPEVTGFAVADAAVAGQGAQAVLKLRQALARGMEPLALIGAIASKLRSMGKAAAIESGRANAADLHMNGWILTTATKQVRGWSSEGLGACIEALAHADQEAKSTSGDSAFAVEQAVELIARRGIPEQA